jgi:N-formylglutamate deformylase
VEVFSLRPPAGPEVPLLVSIPHTGVEVPEAVAGRFASNDVAALPDTDWHLHTLYDFVPLLGAWTVYARYSRYVVDLNRSPDGAALYPGRQETGLVPLSTFRSRPIYRRGEEPTHHEVAARREQFWAPYHAELQTRLSALRERFGYALLWDAHSITSRVPLFFEGELSGLVLGDVDGTSAHPAIADAVLRAVSTSPYRWTRNTPFKGGYITRAYGRPHERIHALQLEMGQRLYMQEEPPFAYDGALAQKLRLTLGAVLSRFVDAGRTWHLSTP